MVARQGIAQDQPWPCFDLLAPILRSQEVQRYLKAGDLSGLVAQHSQPKTFEESLARHREPLASVELQVSPGKISDSAKSSKLRRQLFGQRLRSSKMDLPSTRERLMAAARANVEELEVVMEEARVAIVNSFGDLADFGDDASGGIQDGRCDEDDKVPGSLGRGHCKSRQLPPEYGRDAPGSRFPAPCGTLPH